VTVGGWGFLIRDVFGLLLLRTCSTTCGNSPKQPPCATALPCKESRAACAKKPTNQGKRTDTLRLRSLAAVIIDPDLRFSSSSCWMRHCSSLSPSTSSFFLPKPKSPACARTAPRTGAAGLLLLLLLRVGIFWGRW
jgi:hypothetical protein